ncbi:MAG TPA: hypothetical protein VFW38_09655 [Solirubrobacteraceae bacterium]|nr:hypothetical protein [Solirubrobacteraceae bacterium]
MLVDVPVRRVLVLLGLAIGALSTVFAAPSSGSAGCPNEQFRTGVGASLPDCRAYEQVSPQEKNGGNVDGGLIAFTDPAPQQATPDGENVTYASQTAFSGVNALTAPATSQYTATRGPSGWQTTAIDPSQDFPYGKLNSQPGNFTESLFQGFSEDLKYGFLDAYNPQPVAEAPEGHFNPYLRNNALGSYELIAGLAPPTSTVEEPNVLTGRGLDVVYAGMSGDGKHVIFFANAALTPEAAGGKKVNLYEWNEGSIELVNVLPNGTVDGGGATSPDKTELRYGGRVEQAIAGQATNLVHALSSDGRLAFWTGSNNRLYVHELTSSGAKTVEVSASQKSGAVPETGEYAHFWTASANGELVYFTSCEQLTDDSTAVRSASGKCREERTENFPVTGVGQDLYRYNTSTGKLTDITVDPHPGRSAYVLGVLGASEDGSYVYFAARGALAEGAVETSNEESTQPENTFDIYLWHDGEIHLVTALQEEPGASRSSTGAEAEAWSMATQFRISRVSPNGRYLAFESTKALTSPGITTPATPGGCSHATGENFEKLSPVLFQQLTSDKRCIQVYEYDAAAEDLVCASCRPDGGPPTGNSVVPNGVNSIQPPPGWESLTQQQRYLSDSGRLFFDSTAGLVARDTNGEEDVYEHDPAGVGGCTGTNACLSLISGGTSIDASQFLDAGAEGNDVFFVTHDQLVAADGDGQADLYDARVGGGIVAQQEENVPPCSGEACKPAISTAPAIYGAPASQAFVGGGNPPTPASASPSGPVKKAAIGKHEKGKRRHSAKSRKQKVKKASPNKAHRARVNRGDRRGK